MLNILWSKKGRDFGEGARDLLQSTVRLMIYLIGVFSIGLQIFLAATFPQFFQWKLVPVTAILLLACGVALWTLERIYLLSQVVWLLGMLIAICWACAAYQRAEVFFLLCLLPFVATITLNWQGGVLSAGLILISVMVLRRWEIVPLLPQEYAWGIALGSLVMGCLGWASTSVMTTGLEWSIHSYKQAWENLQETRQHRAQLSRLMKNLDQTHYQLERANTALVAAVRAASEAERLKTEFVANVSHELRTPLNLIIGYSELMALSPESYGGEPLPGAYRSDIHSIYTSACHLRELVDDVLDLGRIENDRIVLSLEDVQPKELINEVVEMVQEYITAKGIDFRLEIQEDLPIISIDRLRIRQALLNLLVNAARFTDQGSICLEVWVEEGNILFGVRDTGRGIAPQDLPHVFDPFYTTGPGTEKIAHAGSGLGLPISKKFIELHNGKMNLESTLNQGTHIWFQTPIQANSMSKLELHSANYQLSNAQLREPGKIVIVAFDDPLLISMLQRHINGIQFIGARDVVEGIGLAENYKAIALISPQGQRDALQQCPVPVICIPYPSSQQEAARMGAAAFLVKPVSAQRLLEEFQRIKRTRLEVMKRVLVVDDDPEMVRLFRRILRAVFPPQDILEAYNGEEALRRLNLDEIDLVFLDLYMPQMDGRAVLNRMKLDPRLAKIPVVIVSGEIWREGDEAIGDPLSVLQPQGFTIIQLLNLVEAQIRTISANWDHIPPREDAFRAKSERGNYEEFQQ
ncbi:MAG TPA: ATP-binding protein [Anaerolineaceae bacterium]